MDLGSEENQESGRGAPCSVWCGVVPFDSVYLYGKAE